MNNRLYRSSTNRMLGGVCGGFAEYAHLDASIVRILTVLFLFTGIGFIAYFAAWIIIPEKSSYTQSCSDLNEKHLSLETSPEVHSTNTNRMLGWALLLMGGFALSQRVWLPLPIRPFIWPAVMIMAGIYLVYKHTSVKEV